MIKKWYTLSLLVLVAAFTKTAEYAPLPTPSAVAGQSDAHAAAKLEHAMLLMMKDGVLKESDRYAENWNTLPRSAASMFESLDLVQRGTCKATSYPWLAAAMQLYRMRKDSLPPMEVMQLLVEAGADVNGTDELKQSAFSYAAESPEMCRYLLSTGANPTLDKIERVRLITLFLNSKVKNMIGLLLEAGASFDGIEASGHSALHLAAFYGNAEACRLLLASGTDVNILSQECDESGRVKAHHTPLDIAIMTRSAEVTKLLLEAGGKTTDASITPLFTACVVGDDKLVKELLAEGADARQSVNSCTPLEVAAYLGHEKVCALLLEAGVSPTEYSPDDQSQTTALHAAAHAGHAAVCKQLLRAGAPVDVVTVRGNTPLMAAAEAEDIGALEVLLEAGADVNAVSHSGRTALMAAAASGREAGVRKLLEAGAKIEEGADSGSLITAALKSSTNALGTVRALIEAGADVNVETKKNTPPIFAALEVADENKKDGVELLRLLLEHGGDVARIWGGKTPLLQAIESGDADVCDVLIATGKALNEAGSDGKLPLLAALESGQDEVCRKLIDAGAMEGDEDGVGQQLFAEAVKKGKLDICRRLVAKGLQPKRWPALHLAAVLGNLDDVKALLAEGGRAASLKVRFKMHTALTYAARMGHAEICRELIRAGADVNQREVSGWTPLIAAVDSGSAETCSVLLEAGADPEVLHGGDPLLIIAVKEKHPEVASVLIKAGVDLQGRDESSGRTALHWAAVTPGLGTICSELIEAGMDVNVRAFETRDTPLHCILSSTSASGLKSPIAQRFIAAGADSTLKNAKGKTPEELAEASCFTFTFGCGGRPSF